jgi:hypothetical protein
MIEKSGFKFNLINNPRTEDGGFGPLRCTICKSKTTMLLQITDIEYHIDMDGHKLTVCKGCLSWMTELIDSGIINEIIKKGEKV